MSLLHKALMNSPQLKTKQQDSSPIQGKCLKIIMDYKDEFELCDSNTEKLHNFFDGNDEVIGGVSIDNLKQYLKEENIKHTTKIKCNISGHQIDFEFDLSDVKSPELKSLGIECMKYDDCNELVLDIGDFNEYSDKLLLDLIVLELTDLDINCNHISCDMILE